MDGKSLCGTFARTGGAGVHLLAAISHTTGDDRTEGIVLAQRHVEQKTSEIAWFAPMLDEIDLAGKVVTADALHTTRDDATYLVERGGHYVFTVKENQHRLYGLLDCLPWHEIPTFTTCGADHGCTERRTVQLAPLGDYLGYPVIDFPYARHAFLIERYTTHHRSGRHSAYAALGITSLSAGLAHPTQIGTYVRNHWHIENRLHWVRDVTFTEDGSRVRTGNAPRHDLLSQQVIEFVHGQGMRRCRYRGLPKAHQQHVLTAIAVNIERLSGLPPSGAASTRGTRWGGQRGQPRHRASFARASNIDKR